MQQNKAMKKSITSNRRPPLRAFYPFVIAIAVPWAMSTNAQAQLYLTQEDAGVVSKYDAKTGAVINANFITGLSFPAGLALRGNTLFVVNNLNGTVGEYDATTGATINANFVTGLSTPFGLAIK